MTVTDLKHKLINKINQTSDNSLLEELYRLLTIDESEFEVLKLTNEQKRDIEIGMKQFRNGQFLTKEQADLEIDEWLSK
jgi:hypothetical protein